MITMCGVLGARCRSHDVRFASVAAVLIALAAFASAVSDAALPPDRPSTARWRVVAGDVSNPRGLFIDRAGVLWAAVAGRGGPMCASRHGRICYGRTGKILRIVHGRVSTFASRLASIHNYLGVLGADDVSVAPDGSVFTAMITDEGELPTGANTRVLGGQLGRLLRFDSHGHPTVQANLLNDTFGSDFGHPYGVLALPGRELVVDSEQNELVEVRGQHVRVIFRFPPGAHHADSVPTSLAAGADGTVYVGELSGENAGPGHARIWRILPGQKPHVFATGFNAITGIAVGLDGSVYVCEYSLNYAHNDNHGDVVRLDPDGTRTVYGAGRLFHPGGIAVANNGAIYVSNWSAQIGRAHV